MHSGGEMRCKEYNLMYQVHLLTNRLDLELGGAYTEDGHSQNMVNAAEESMSAEVNPLNFSGIRSAQRP